jgi:hypothetical protein
VKQDDDEEEYEQKTEFKTYRRFMFLLGKFFKYASWTFSALFLYHFFLVMRKEKPEESFGATEPILNYAY